MGAEEPRQRQPGDLRAAQHHVLQRITHDRDHGADLGADDRCPVGPLVPRQEIAGEAEGEGHQQEHDTGQPGHLARVLVGAVDDHAHHVQDDEQDHGARTPVVKAADQPPQGKVVGDVFDAGVGLLGIGHVVQRQQDPGGELQDHRKERGAAQGVGPVDLGDVPKEDGGPVAPPTGTFV